MNKIELELRKELDQTLESLNLIKDFIGTVISRFQNRILLLPKQTLDEEEDDDTYIVNTTDKMIMFDSCVTGRPVFVGHSIQKSNLEKKDLKSSAYKNLIQKGELIEIPKVEYVNKERTISAKPNAIDYVIDHSGKEPKIIKRSSTFLDDPNQIYGKHWEGDLTDKQIKTIIEERKKNKGNLTPEQQKDLINILDTARFEAKSEDEIPTSMSVFEKKLIEKGKEILAKKNTKQPSSKPKKTVKKNPQSPKNTKGRK